MGAEKETEKSKSTRPSFSVRLQPYEKSLLAEVVQYLNALERGDAKRQVENVLVMALLAQARLYDESCSDEERRRCCIEACDALDKHASMLRQLVGVAGPGRSVVAQSAIGAISQQKMVTPPVVAKGVESNLVEMDGDVDEEEDEQWPPKARIEGRASADEVNSLFGG